MVLSRVESEETYSHLNHGEVEEDEAMYATVDKGYKGSETHVYDTQLNKGGSDYEASLNPPGENTKLWLILKYSQNIMVI